MAEGTGHQAVHVPAGAGHLFEEPGALDQVVVLATQWLQRWLPLISGTA